MAANLMRGRVLSFLSRRKGQIQGQICHNRIYFEKRLFQTTRVLSSKKLYRKSAILTEEDITLVKKIINKEEFPTFEIESVIRDNPPANHANDDAKSFNNTAFRFDNSETNLPEG